MPPRGPQTPPDSHHPCYPRLRHFFPLTRPGRCHYRETTGIVFNVPSTAGTPHLAPTPSFPHCAILAAAPVMAANSEKRDGSPKPSRNRWFRKALLDVASSEWDILAFSTAFK